MKHLLTFLLFISLALSGYQDMVDVEMCCSRTIQTETASITSTDKNITNRFFHENKGLTHFYAGNVNYVQTLFRISQESENAQVSSEQIRLFQKFISGFILKDYNIKQRISEQVSTFQSIARSTLHCHSAHLIFLLRKIVI